MKIAVVVNELDIRGGTHKQVLRLCQYLKHQGEDCTVYTRYYDPDMTYPEFRELDVVCLHNGPRPAFPKNAGIAKKFLKALHLAMDEWKLLRKIPRDVDVVNVHDNGIPNLIYFAKTLYRAKVVWQINDLPHCFSVGISKTAGKRRLLSLRQKLFRKLAQCVDRITVNVSKNGTRVQECMFKDADVFYCGVDINDSLIHHTANQEGGSIRILSTGVFFPYRNYETLIDVVEKMLGEGKQVRLDIIGSTTQNVQYADLVRKLVADKKLEQFVKIWGQVDEKTYSDLYNQAHLFAFVNIDQSWGLAVFEAMSCGLPVIVSNSVGATELLHNDVDSVIVDPKNVDEICNVFDNLMENSEYYNRISQNAATAVKKYTWDKLYSEKMKQLFDQLTGN